MLITDASYQRISSATSARPPSTGVLSLAVVVANTSSAAPFAGPHGQDPPPPGSGC